MDAFAAVDLLGHSAQGQTVPLYLSCRVDGREVVYQTKLAGRRSGLSTRELGVEMFGTTIAHDAGLHVAKPALVTLPVRMLEAVERRYAFGVEDATAFGVAFRSELTPFLPDVELMDVPERERAMLLAIDLLLTNGDRTEPNPNVCWDDHRLLVFDFEHCLELPKGDYARRRERHLESLAPLFETHLMTQSVGPRALCAAVERLLGGLRVDALRRDAFSLPLSWHESWLDNVEYLGYIRSEPEVYLRRIEELIG